MSCSCRVLECAICTTSYTRSMVIKTATPEELMQNELVSQLIDRLRREIRNGMNHFDDCKVFFEDADGFDIDANESEICNCGAAWEYNQSLEALKNFEVKDGKR